MQETWILTKGGNGHTYKSNPSIFRFFPRATRVAREDNLMEDDATGDVTRYASDARLNFSLSCFGHDFKTSTRFEG